jgi:hypothetical protein
MSKHFITVGYLLAAVAIGFYGAKYLHLAYLEATKQPAQVETVRSIELVGVGR